MRVQYQLDTVDQLEATITITMKVEDWIDLANQLAKDWPSWRLGSEIRDMVRKAKQSFEEIGDFEGY